MTELKKRRIVERNLFYKMADQMKIYSENKENLDALGKAMTFFAKICDEGYINSGLALPVVAIAENRLSLVADYIKNCGGNPCFKDGDDLFEIDFDAMGHWYFSPVEKTFTDAEGNTLPAKNLADLTCEINFDAIEYLETFTAYAHFIGGERRCIGRFDTKKELEKFMADLRKELGFVRNYDLDPLADDLVKDVKTEEIFWIEEDDGGNFIIASDEEILGKFDSLRQAKRELRKMLYRG